jgi:hypothetical protein
MLCLAALTMGCTANAQEYQKAKQILEGQIKISTSLREFPDPEAQTVGILRTKEPVYILGKQDNWLDVQSSQQRGWVSSFYVDVFGVTKNQNVKIIKKNRKTSLKPVRNETDQAFFNNLRFVPYFTYAKAGKAFYDHLRVGAYGTLKVNDLFSVGVLTDLILINGTYLAVGPTFHRELPAASTWLKPSVMMSLLYYKFSNGNDEDAGFGIQWAIENDLPLIEKPKFRLRPVLRLGVDTIFINVDQMRIPYWGSLGVSVQF